MGHYFVALMAARPRRPYRGHHSLRHRRGLLQLEAIILRERLDLPVLTIEGDRPGPLDARTRTRLEAFLEQTS